MKGYAPLCGPDLEHDCNLAGMNSVAARESLIFLNTTSLFLFYFLSTGARVND